MGNVKIRWNLSSIFSKCSLIWCRWLLVFIWFIKLYLSRMVCSKKKILGVSYWMILLMLFLLILYDYRRNFWNAYFLKCRKSVSCKYLANLWHKQWVFFMCQQPACLLAARVSPFFFLFFPCFLFCRFNYIYLGKI